MDLHNMDNLNLENRIKELEKWKEEKTVQQIAFPLDTESRRILSNYFMSLSATVRTIGGAGGNEFIYYTGQQGDKDFQVSINTFIPYTVNTTNDTISVQKIAFENDTQVYVSTSDTPPTPLDTVTNYYIINSTGLTFQLSLTSGGAAINITDTGVGSQYIYYF